MTPRDLIPRFISWGIHGPLRPLRNITISHKNALEILAFGQTVFQTFLNSGAEKKKKEKKIREKKVKEKYFGYATFSDLGFRK